jgi:UDP-3-O-[3-hydroxymyristoyl] N-acetylglucosamine deacetylase
MINFQRTLKKSVSTSGVGVHSGAEATITLKPAPVGTGIVFKRTDLPHSPLISAHYQNVSNTQLATTLGIKSLKVCTVEHLLAAFQGAGVNNAVVEVRGNEVPILDGSSIGFYNLILEAGLQTQRKFQPVIVIQRRVQLSLGEKWAIVEPSTHLEVHSTIQWDHPVIGNQDFHYIDGVTDFNEIASARTFGFLKDFDALKKEGLARGGSLDNAIVLSERDVLNPDGLRYSDEFVRHKVLDALGDIKLAGLPIYGYFRFHRSGHDLHLKLLSEIFSNPLNYERYDDRDTPTKKVRTQLQPALTQPGFVATYT